MMKNETPNINNNDNKKIEISYYAARFSQKVGAIMVDFITFLLLALAIFVGLKEIVENSSYYLDINQKYDQARLDSFLYVYNDDLERVEDIVTYINRRSDMAASEKETFLIEHIYSFFDSLPEFKAELVEEYNNFLLDENLVYNDEPYFIKDDNGEIIKNNNYSIPTIYYVDNVYKVYIDNIGLAQFLIKTPNVIDYQRYQSNMLLFLELPLSLIISTTIVFYIVPLIFYRGHKTLGRLAFKIGLVDHRNLNVKFLRFTIRFLIFLFLEVLLSAVTFCIPLIVSISMSAFSKKRQNFHDYMVDVREVDTYGSKIYLDKFDILKDYNKPKLKDFHLK